MLTTDVDQKSHALLVDELETRLSSHFENILQPTLDKNLGFIILLANRYMSGQGSKASVERHLNKCIERLGEFPLGGGLYIGFTGLAWLVQVLDNHGILDAKNYQFIFEELDPLVLKAANHEFRRNNYDLLDGLVGFGLYYLTKPDLKKNQENLTLIVDHLLAIGIETDKDFYWEYKLPQSEEMVINFGMAHGLPSVISFLAKVRSKGILLEKIDPVLKKSTHTLLKFKRKKGRSYFSPNSQDSSESRLAWCYGDLGVALGLAHVANSLDNHEIHNEVMAIVDHSLSRMLKDSGVYTSDHTLDKGFCHGTIGLAHIYMKFYQRYGKEEYLKAARYWMDLTIADIDLASDDLNIRMVVEKKEDGYRFVPEAGLLEGSLGVAMVLQSSFSHKRHIAWDSIFLTDIDV